MPFAPTDLERIRKHLNIPAEKYRLDILRISMSRIENESPDSIATVQAILTRLDVNRKKLLGIPLDPDDPDEEPDDGAYGDVSFAMIQADVIKWQPGSRTDGMEILQARLQRELASTLLIDIPESYGYGTLSRS